MNREFSEPNLFFWIPRDASHEEKIRQTERWVIKAWEQLSDPKNGAWQPEKPESMRKVRVIPLGGVGPGHATFKEGHDAYLVRDERWHMHRVHATDEREYASVEVKPDGSRWRWCNKFRFWRMSKITRDAPLWLPDRVAVKLQRKGLLKVLDWDTQDAERESHEPLVLPERKSGERVKTLVPY